MLITRSARSLALQDRLHHISEFSISVISPLVLFSSLLEIFGKHLHEVVDLGLFVLVVASEGSRSCIVGARSVEVMWGSLRLRDISGRLRTIAQVEWPRLSVKEQSGNLDYIVRACRDSLCVMGLLIVHLLH